MTHFVFEKKTQGIKRDTYSMILIGSATASLIFLFALLLWAFLLTVERFSKLPFLPFPSTYLRHYISLIFAHTVQSRSLTTVQDLSDWRLDQILNIHLSPAPQTVQPTQQSSFHRPLLWLKSFHGLITDTALYHMHLFVWICFSKYLQPHCFLHPDAMRTRCIQLLLWSMSPPTWSPPMRKTLTSHRRSRRAILVPWRRYCSQSIHMLIKMPGLYLTVLKIIAFQ